MSASYTRLYVHCVWATSDRQPVLDEQRARRVHGLLGRLCRDQGCAPVAIGGVADHVHVLVSLHPKVAVADLVRVLKVGTSQFIADRLRVPDFAWQNGYGAFSLREVEGELVRRYVIDQPRHHALGTALDNWERTDERCSEPTSAATPALRGSDHALLPGVSRRR